MRNIKHILTRSLLLAAVLFTAACTGNFEEYNRNPDQPSSVDRDVWDYIRSMEYAVVPTVKNKYQIRENVSGGAYGRYFAYAKANDAGWVGKMFAFFRIDNQWANSHYEDTMTDIYSNWRAIRRDLEDPDGDYRMALAQIVRVAAIQRLTDTQGPVPYRTMENSDDITAAYESQQDVYGYMLEDLDGAIDVLDAYVAMAGTEVVEEAASRDYLYRGNLAQWLRFANSLKLRLAMRISLVAPAEAERCATEAVSHPRGVIVSNADNAALDVSSTNDRNPLRWMVDEYNDCHAAAEIVTYMKGLDDPRIGKYFRPAASDGQWHGSRVGAASYSRNHTRYSLPVVGELDRLMWLNAAEVAFCKAEMALNGWAVAGSAQEHYEEGIRLSFEQYGAEGCDDYLAGTSSPSGYADPLATNSYSPDAPYTVTVAWGGTPEAQREKIATQKWIALYPLGTEAWAEQRRTGWPRFYPSPAGMNANSEEPELPAKGAARIPFAPNEKTRNADNYAAAVALLGPGGDRFSTRLWWDVKQDKMAW